ncbi:MAG TPA: prepilin-type N-terminal cleavage/methylation domain-containing protein [Candidatus Saccharimonadales bacterium]|nr:prepilin-type N-terminal cleavage/methylation domain-containing protein [Candidatus Saccharimonadales bacterium]
MERDPYNGRRRPDGGRGFTLPEILAVVALIGLIAVVAIPAFGTFVRAWRVRSAADDMLAAVRSVRQMAITTRQPLTVTFTPGSPGSYSYFHPLQGRTVTVKLPDQMTLVTNPSSSFAPAFQVNGGIIPSSTPSVSNPTANYVKLSSVIASSRTDVYTFGFSAAGQVTYRVTR